MSDRRATYRVIEATEERRSRLSTGFHRLGIALAAIPFLLGVFSLGFWAVDTLRPNNQQPSTYEVEKTARDNADYLDKLKKPEGYEGQHKFAREMVLSNNAFLARSRQRERDDAQSTGLLWLLGAALIYGGLRAVGWILNGFFHR